MYIGDVFVIPLGSKYAILQQKYHSTRAVESRKLFIVRSKVTTIESLRLSTDHVESNFCCKLENLEPRGHREEKT